MDLIIRSYHADFEFLTYCLKSIARFATGFRRVVVIVPHGQRPPTGSNETVFYVHEYGEGYMAQQSDKLHADAFSDADFLLYMDSDTVFTRPITPRDVTLYGKATWLYTPRASMGQYGTVWKLETEKALRRPVEHEFMRRHPLCVPRWALEGMRAWFWREHGQSLEHYIISQPGRQFSEWNCLGAWLWFHHRDRIEWINTDEKMGVPFVEQYYSWDGLTADVRRKLELAVA